MPLLRGLAKGVGMGAGMAGGQRLVDNLFGARNGNQQQPQQNQQVHCPFCNCFNANTQRFCGTCGKDMYTPQPAMSVQPAIPQPQAGSGAICPSCGYVNEQGKKFCNSCGASLVPPVASTPTPVPYTHHENPSTSNTVVCACGYSNPIGGKYCLECGAKCGVQIEKPVIPAHGTNSITCGRCGEMVSGKVCPQCGAKF